MNKEPEEQRNRPMRSEYDFSPGERGKYAERYAQGTNLIRLAPDVAKDFPDDKAVNAALRAYRKITRLAAK